MYIVRTSCQPELYGHSNGNPQPTAAVSMSHPPGAAHPTGPQSVTKAPNTGKCMAAQLVPIVPTHPLPSRANPLHSGATCCPKQPSA